MLRYCLLILACSGLSAAELPEVAPDWQLPYFQGDALTVHADSRGTTIRYSDGGTHTLLSGSRGFPPVVTQEHIYATNTDGDLLAWNRADREIAWQRRFEGWIFPPLPRGGALYLAGQAHRLYRLDAATGTTEASLALTNEAIYSPVAWDGNRIAIGVYSRAWLVIDGESLDVVERFDTPEPAISALPPGLFLAQNGSVYQRTAAGTFDALLDGPGPVRWLDRRDRELLWTTDRRVWRAAGTGVRCREADHPVTFLGPLDTGYRVQTTNPYGTSGTVRLSELWAMPNDTHDKENRNEKIVDRVISGDHGRHAVVRPCRTLRHE